MTSKERQKGSIVNSFLNSVEKIGNKLPDPSVLFFLMCVGLAILTWLV
ncbi:AbgT family transporter, partial [Staphylococcus aureus]